MSKKQNEQITTGVQSKVFKELCICDLRMHKN